MTIEVEKSHLVYALAPYNEPVMHVPDGSTVVFNTCDCFEDQIERADQDFGELDWERINPATGPVYVDGAEPGDLLAIYIDDIALADRGVMTTGPNLGVLGDELTQNVIRMIPIEDGEAVFSKDLKLPLHPMIGVIGTAPAAEAVACGTPGSHGGNMDCRRITTGACLILPVNVPGALLAMGDLHATMGDGEVAVCGVEIAGRVTVRVQVLKEKPWPAPMIVNDDAVMTIASEKTLDEAAVSATKHMVRWLESECGMETAEATFLLSAVGELRICQVVDPLKTCRMELPRWIAEQKGFTFPA